MTRPSAPARRLATWTAAVVIALACASRPAAAQPLAAASTTTRETVPSPDSFFGFRIGSDRQIASADRIERYFEEVAGRSPRVRLLDLGATTDGHRTIAALVSSPHHLAELERIRSANQSLADPRRLTPAEAAALARTQPAVVAIGASIHATEIGGSQALIELLHRLATEEDDETVATLEQTVTILIPILNPDGHRLVTDWYERQKGNSYEGGPMPWLYHRYAGHDINRDGFMMNLAESRNLSAFFYGQWHPQVFLTLHQMGTNGPRIFVPPNADPIDPNYDPLLWRTAGLLGGAMGFELQRAGRRGVLSNGIYDYYWPGYEDSAPLGHNTVCLLAEVASARVASPLTVTAGELRGGQPGLPEYRPQINFPDPWPGGTWTLRDIVDYDLTAVNGLLKAIVRYREPIVQNFYDMGRRAVTAGEAGGPFAFLIPPAQRDPLAAAKLRALLLQGHVEIQHATAAFRAAGVLYPAGSDIILMAQPFRSYAKTLLERQQYPTPPGRTGPAERPYDVTGWTLPLQMGVAVLAIEQAFDLPPYSPLSSASSTAALASVASQGSTPAATRPTPGPGTERRGPAPSETARDVARPGHYVIEAPGATGALAAARLLAASVPLAWVTTSRDVNGFHYEPGTLVIPTSPQSAPLVTALARDLGLHVERQPGRPPTRGVTAIGRARIGIYGPWFDNMSEGWTRWLLDEYGLRYTTLRDGDFRGRPLRERVDAIIIASAPVDRLIAGNSATAYPPEYAGGLGDAGLAALRAFVRDGGTLVTFDQASELAIRVFDLPIRDAARGQPDRFLCPGSLVRLQVDTTDPLSFGMPPETAAFFSFSSAFVIDPASQQADHGASAPREPAVPVGAITTIARYGTHDVLLSGYIEGEQVIAGQSAVLNVQVGAGRIVLFGFEPHHRGQTLATFRLLFNALFTTPGATAPQAGDASSR